MKSIFVYGITTLNVGDDLFLRILFERYPDTKMVLFAPHIYKSLFQEFENVVVVSHGDKIVNKIIKISRFLHIPYTLFLYIFLFIKYKINLFLIVGGSLFMEGKSSMPSILRKTRLLKVLFPNVKVAIIGSNFGPYKTDNFYKKIKKYLSHVDDICFRDKASFDLFSTNPKVRWGNDLVLHLEKDRIIKKKTVCINIRSVEKWPTLKPFKDNYLNLMRSFIEEFQTQGYNIKLLSFCKGYGDDEITNELFEQLKNKDSIEKVFYSGNISEILCAVAESEYMIATRFHAVILGFVYNVAVLPISYSVKTENMLKTLGLWDDIYNFGSFCYSSPLELKAHYLKNVFIDKSKNTQFDWLDKYILTI